ncbi:MAG: hypothetical protein ACJ76A_01545 [Actinomycetota bacterium]
MALRNRMTPLGEPIAVDARGLVYGNRGNMHDARRRIRRPYGVKRWIACQLSFRGWHRAPLMQPGRFTELFFLDEATAFAAGHRPCRLCRFDDYESFVDVWTTIHPHRATNADAIDDVLHRERWDPHARAQRRHEARLDGLPDGTFVLGGGDVPWLVLGPHLIRWTPSGYTERQPRRPRATATVITPPSLIGVLETERTPLVPFLHPSAHDA